MHDCPACRFRVIADEMYLCNIDADQTPRTLIITYGTAWDAHDTLALAAVLAAVLDALGRS